MNANSKIKFRMTVGDAHSRWQEEYEYPLEKVVEGFCFNMIKNFNNTLRSGEESRDLYGVEIL